MIKILILFFFLQFALNVNATNYGEFKAVITSDTEQVIITSWNSKEGIKLFNKAKYKNDFFVLANHFQPQINPLYCGIASSVIVLNALNEEKQNIKNSHNSINKPDSFGGGIIPFKSYTQYELLDNQTDKIKDRDVINFKAIDPNLNRYDPGLTLKQLAEILKYHRLNIQLYYADKSAKNGVAKFQKDLENILNKKDIYILANFQGKKIGSLTSGHISPIVAYNKSKKQILILDVASHKQPWFWVDIEEFYKAMQEKDGAMHRGYLIVSKD